jgi:hypothetical protein
MLARRAGMAQQLAVPGGGGGAVVRRGRRHGLGRR